MIATDAVLWLPVLGLYFLPFIIAASRGVRNQASILIINLFLGWTLIGWVVALAMAARTVDKPTRTVPAGMAPTAQTPDTFSHTDPPA